MERASVPPPQKRPRLNYEPSINNIFRARERNAGRLKSRFESIFAKYEKDFTGLGDEIDLVTGKIVVNNGHLLTMSAESDDQGDVDELAEPGITPRSSALAAENAGKPQFEFATPRRPLQKTPTSLSKLGGRLAALQAEQDLEGGRQSTPRASTPRASTPRMSSPRAPTPAAARLTPFVPPRRIPQLDSVYFSPRGRTPGPSLAAISRATPCPFESPAPKKTPIIPPPTESRWKTPLLFNDSTEEPVSFQDEDEEDEALDRMLHSRSPSPEKRSIWIDAPSRDTSPQPTDQANGIDSEDIRRHRHKGQGSIKRTNRTQTSSGRYCKSAVLEEARRDMKAAEESYFSETTKVRYFRRKWLREAGLLLFNIHREGQDGRRKKRRQSEAVEATKDIQRQDGERDHSYSSPVSEGTNSRPKSAQREPLNLSKRLSEGVDHSYRPPVSQPPTTNANFFKDRLKRQRKPRQFSEFLRTDHSILEDGTLALPDSAQKPRDDTIRSSDDRKSTRFPSRELRDSSDKTANRVSFHSVETVRLEDTAAKLKKRRRKTTGTVESDTHSVIDLLAEPPVAAGDSMSQTPSVAKRPRGRPRKSAPAQLSTTVTDASVANVVPAHHVSQTQTTQTAAKVPPHAERVVLDSQATTAAPLSSVTTRPTPRKRLMRKSSLIISSLPDDLNAEDQSDRINVNTQLSLPVASSTSRATPRKRLVNKSSLLSSSFPLPSGTEAVSQDLQEPPSTVPESTQDLPAPLDAEADQLSTPHRAQRTKMLPMKLRVLGSSPQMALRQRTSQSMDASQSSGLSSTRSSEFRDVGFV